jgi:DNA polymerase III delta prime subunit
MRIHVDLKKIIDAPIENASSIDRNKMKTIKQELIMGNPTTYLVSGYRGVGKTSFIKTLITEINAESDGSKSNSPEKSVGILKRLFCKKKTVMNYDVERKNKIFIHLNVGKYSGFSNILRCLVREIYWGLNNGSEQVRRLLKENTDLYSEIELIYARTFQDVEIKNSDIENDETEKSFLFSTNFRTLLVRISTVLLGSVSFINYIKGGDWKSYVIPIIILTFLLFSFEYAKKKSRINKREFNRKTFYDDEVAEFQLIRIISRLDDLGIELVFIIDELDKLDKEEDILSLISDLKPLMLLGKSNYMLIFGQKMLYKYLMADVLDNNILSSIFTRNIHIPLLSKSGFESYFVALIGENNLNDLIIRRYLDAKILLSNRIFRRFIAIIRNDIVFDNNGQTYIEIKENDQVLLTNATISTILFQVEEEIIQETMGNIEEGVKDFLVSNLYIAVKSMKRMRPVSFTIDDILKNKNFIDDEFASAYLNYIRKYIKSIIDKMINQNLLEAVKEMNYEENNEENEKIRYRWTESAVLDKVNNSPFAYLDEFIKFESWLRDIFYQLQKYFFNKPYVRSISIMKILNELSKEEVISGGNIKDFARLNETRNKIVHGHEITENEKESLVTFSQDLRNFKSFIFEKTMIFLINRINDRILVNESMNFFNYYEGVVVKKVLFEFKIVLYEKNVEKSLENLKKIKLNNELVEIRVIILLDNEFNKLSIQNKIAEISKNNQYIQVKLIEKVDILELEEFLKVI